MSYNKENLFDEESSCLFDTILGDIEDELDDDFDDLFEDVLDDDSDEGLGLADVYRGENPNVSAFYKVRGYEYVPLTECIGLEYSLEKFKSELVGEI